MYAGDDPHDPRTIAKNTTASADRSKVVASKVWPVPCVALSLAGWKPRAPFLDIMTVQDLRLEIRRDGTATATPPAELKWRVRAVVSGGKLN
jgi:hypothetical protein